MSALMKQAVFLTSLILSVTIGSGVIMWIGLTTELFPPNSINAETYKQYGMKDLTVEGDGQDSVSGLQSFTIEFKFDNDGKPGDKVKQSGLSALGEGIRQKITSKPVLYNVSGKLKGAQDARTVGAFDFQSVSPSDYADESYSSAAADFSRLINDSRYASVQYKSTVNSAGTRIADVVVKVNPETMDSPYGSYWNALLDGFFPRTNTVYNVTLNTTTDTSEVHASFTGSEEQERLMKVDPLLIASGNTIMKSVTEVKPVNTVTTVAANGAVATAVTVAAPKSERSVIDLFAQAVQERKLFPFPGASTVTLTVDEQPTPFQIFYPSEKEL